MQITVGSWHQPAVCLLVVQNIKNLIPSEDLYELLKQGRAVKYFHFTNSLKQVIVTNML